MIYFISDADLYNYNLYNIASYGRARYMQPACGIHAKSMLDTACKHVSLGRSEGYVKNTFKIHAGTVFRLYLACIL